MNKPRRRPPIPNGLTGRFSAILLIGHRFEPFHVRAVLLLLHGNVLGAVFRRGAVPMLFARRNLYHVAGADFAHRTAPALRPARSERGRRATKNKKARRRRRASISKLLLMRSSS
jgi:hypothetical protein